MANFLNNAQESTATTGTGTVTLGGATALHQSWSAAGAVNAKKYSYRIDDGTAWEIGIGVYTSSGTTLTRVLIQSSTGSLLSLTGAAVVSQVVAAHDIRFKGCSAKKNGDQTTADYTGGGAGVVIPFDGTDDYDTDGWHDPSSGNTKMTVPANLGIEYVECHAWVDAQSTTSGTFGQIIFRKNGDTANGTFGFTQVELTNTGRRMASSAVIPATDGDYIEVLYREETDTSITIVAVNTRFTIRAVG